MLPLADRFALFRKYAKPCASGECLGYALKDDPDTLYMGDFRPKKFDPAINVVVERYIRNAYQLAHSTPISPEDLITMKGEMVEMGKYSIDASFLKP